MKKIIVTGILKEKTFGNTQNGNAYARITLSELGFKKDGTTFESKTNVTVWSQTLVNGLVNIYENSMLLIEGDVSVRMYDKQDGTKGATLDITANNINVLDTPSVPEATVQVYGPQPMVQQPVMQQPIMQQPMVQPMAQPQPVMQQEPVSTVEIPVGYTNYNNNNFNGM